MLFFDSTIKHKIVLFTSKYNYDKNNDFRPQLFNNYPVTMPLLVVGITEIIATGWIFGIEK